MTSAFMTNVSPDDLAAALLDALQKVTRKGTLAQVERRQLVRTCVLLLQQRLGVSPPDANNIASKLEESYLTFRDTGGDFGDGTDVRRIEAEIWKLINRGLIYPRFNTTGQFRPVDPGNPPWGIQFLVLTEVGRRFVQDVQPHPYRPDFVERVLSACQDLPAGVVARLEDAHDCWRNNLHRAAVVMLGLAYEQVARVLFDNGGVLAKISHNTTLHRRCQRGGAKPILEGLREALQVCANPKQPDEKDVLSINFADSIRQHRNTAAHDWKRKHLDQGQIEELMVIGGRTLPKFWDIRHRI